MQPAVWRGGEMSWSGRFPCLGGVLLTASVVSCASLAYWLLAESDHNRVHDILEAHGRLVAHERRKEAVELLTKSLASAGEGPLDPIWLRLMSSVSNGYVRLGYYIRILRSDPAREATYYEISSFIEQAPKAFHDEVKAKYLGDLADVPGVRSDYLEKYGLVSDEAGS